MLDHPAFAGCQRVVPLSGFSGALIVLVTDSRGHSFVRKVTEKPDGSDKLRTQATRQNRLREVLQGIAHVPEILDEGEADGCYWYDMTYAVGRDAGTHLDGASREQFDAFVDKLCASVQRLASTTIDTEPRPIFPAIAAKLHEIDTKTAGRYRSDLARLSFAASMIDCTLAPTETHGDLTLENIIVDRLGELWLFDTIASPIDHYWTDLSKIFQDCEGRWFLHRKRALSIGMTWQLRQRVFSFACGLDPTYARYHYLLLALVFARILPYTKTAVDAEFVTDRVSRFTLLCEAAIERFG